MRKIVQFLKFQFLNQLQFRFEIVLWIILDMIPFGVLFIVMKTIYEHSTVIHSYTASDIIFYYFIVVFIQSFTSTHFEGWRVDEIKNGKIDGYLLRPFSYLKEIVVRDIAGKMFSIILFLPFYLIFFVITQSMIAFPLPEVSWLQGVAFIGFLAFAYFIEMSIGLIIVLLGFWFEGSQGLEHFKWISITLLSGSMIPLEFLPNWLKTISERLPFQYMYAMPINMIQGKVFPQLQDLATIIVSILILIAIISIIWKKAIYTYTSSGG